MQYFITYNKKTGEIVGSSRASGPEAFPYALLAPNEAVLEVTEKNHIELLDKVDFRSFVLKGTIKNEKIEMLKSESLFEGSIKLTIDAMDKDADGKPELPADGTSSARVTAILKDLKGNLLKRNDVTVRFRASHGSLSRREATTKNGEANVILTSSRDTKDCRLIASAERFRKDALVVEYIPEEEFKSLKAEK